MEKKQKKIKKQIRKLYRLMPLNNEIKGIEAGIYKNRYKGQELNNVTYYLKGLKKAKNLVKSNKINKNI